MHGWSFIIERRKRKRRRFAVAVSGSRTFR